MANVGTWDIVGEYDWTSIPRGSNLRSISPKVVVTSFRLKGDNITRAYRGMVAISSNLIGDNAERFYDEMYSKSTELEDVFSFPYFDSDIRSFGNTFGDTFQDAFGGGQAIASSLNDMTKKGMGIGIEVAGRMGDEALTNGADAIRGGNFAVAANIATSSLLSDGNPGTYAETPMYYQYAKNDGNLNVTFTLSNTVNEDALDTNHELVKHLTKINRPLRKNSISVEPPRIYEVVVPGHRYIKWAYCENFGVELLGNRRILNGVIHPEGYRINMSFKSLTMEHAGFMDEI